MKRPTTLPRGIGWLLPGTILVAVLLDRGSAAQVARPAVGIRFAITAPAFVETMGPRLDGLQADAARRIGELCAAELSYVEWRALTNPPAAGDPSWTLKGTMLAEGSSVIPAVVLQFEKMGPGHPATLLVREPLYAANDLEQPTQEEARFRDELLGKLRTVFENSQNLGRLQTRFLAGIPVARRIDANPALQRVVLPARWGEMLPGDGSLLRAQYEVVQPDGGKVGVRVRLSPSVPFSDQVTCAVTLFDYPPVSQMSWHPSMPESLSNAVPDSIRVFMEQYVKDYNYSPATSGDLVLQPFGLPGLSGNGGAP